MNAINTQTQATEITAITLNANLTFTMSGDAPVYLRKRLMAMTVTLCALKQLNSKDLGITIVNNLRTIKACSGVLVRFNKALVGIVNEALAAEKAKIQAAAEERALEEEAEQFSYARQCEL